MRADTRRQFVPWHDGDGRTDARARVIPRTEGPSGIFPRQEGKCGQMPDANSCLGMTSSMGLTKQETLDKKKLGLYRNSNLHVSKFNFQAITEGPMMRRISIKSLLVTSILFFAESYASAFPQHGRPWDQLNFYNDFFPFQRSVTAQGDFLRALGELRLHTAYAELALARAQGEWARVRAYSAFINTLNQDSIRLEARLKQNFRLLVKVDKQGQKLNGILKGKTDPATVSALEFFLAMIPGEKLAGLIQLDIPALNKEDFKLRWLLQTVKDPVTGEPSRQEIVLEDFAGGNLYNLIAYLRHFPVQVVVGSQAHLVLIELRNQLVAAGSVIVEELEGKMSNLSEEKTNLWAPAVTPYASLPARVPPN